MHHAEKREGPAIDRRKKVRKAECYHCRASLSEGPNDPSCVQGISDTTDLADSGDDAGCYSPAEHCSEGDPLLCRKTASFEIPDWDHQYHQIRGDVEKSARNQMASRRSPAWHYNVISAIMLGISEELTIPSPHPREWRTPHAKIEDLNDEEADRHVECSNQK